MPESTGRNAVGVGRRHPVISHTTAHDPVSQPITLCMHSIFFTFLSQLQIWVTIIPNKII